MTAQQILSQLKGVRRNGDGWLALCPAHDDHHPSLSLKDTRNGSVWIHCFAGCSVERVCSALGIDTRSLNYEEPPGKGSGTQPGQNGSEIVNVYDYIDEGGTLLFQVVRRVGKRFQQRRPTEDGRWIWNLNGVRRVLYRLPEILNADASGTIFVTEGEKDTDRLTELGLLATTNPGGAGKWRSEYNEVLRG